MTHPSSKPPTCPGLDAPATGLDAPATGLDAPATIHADGNLATSHAARHTSPGLLLWLVTNAWQRQIRQALAPHDLTHVQFVLLANLASIDREHPVTQGELSRLAGTDPMMTSQVVRTLAAKNLVTRSTHPNDARAIIVAPTDQGIQLVNAANQAVEQTDSRYFSPLGEDIAAFVKLLNTLA